MESWDNVASVSTGFRTTLALKTDGTILVTGANDMGQCNFLICRQGDRVINELFDEIKVLGAEYNNDEAPTKLG